MSGRDERRERTPRLMSPAEALRIIAFGLFVLATAPYLTSPADPIQFILGLWPWLLRHPLRLLATLPMVVWLLPMVRVLGYD